MRCRRLYWIVAVVVTGSAGACARRASTADEEAFVFLVRPPAPAVGGEVWEAIAGPLDESQRSRPATFRLYLPAPGRDAPAGRLLHAALRRGDPGGEQFFTITFGPAFEPQGPQSGGTALEPRDSLPLTLTIRPEARAGGPWVATAELPDGARFLLTLDSARGQGRFTPIDRRDNLRILNAMGGLVLPRDLW